MQESGLSPNSIKSYSITLKAFLSWCNTEGLTSLNMAKYKGEETILIKETLNKSAAAERRAFCPIRAVPKLGNTQPSFWQIMMGTTKYTEVSLPMEYSMKVCSVSYWQLRGESVNAWAQNIWRTFAARMKKLFWANLVSNALVSTFCTFTRKHFYLFLWFFNL